jgi:hypothetical protein
MGFYNCPYILRSGEVCNAGCYHVKGCTVHRNSPIKNPCIECGKMNYSKYGACRDHAGKYRSYENYHKKKIAKFDQLSSNFTDRSVSESHVSVAQ